MAPRLVIDSSIAGLVRAGIVLVEGVDPSRAPEDLGALVSDLEATLRDLDAGKRAGDIERLQDARRLYRAFGLDPTRHRPSPEALLRRVLRGDAFPRLHAAVDLANLWALVHGLPVGLYDVAALEGETLVLRRGSAGESYEGIRKPEVNLEGRLLLADDRGPFGNPSSDSQRTAVRASTRDVLAVVFATADYREAELARWNAWLAERAPLYLGAERVESALVPGVGAA